jgi:hypothetical protein
MKTSADLQLRSAGEVLKGFCVPGDTGCLIPVPLPGSTCGNMPVESMLELMRALHEVHGALLAGADPAVLREIWGMRIEEEEQR